MSFNTAGTKEVPISVFGGLVTEPPAQSLPDGVSPDNQDVEFTPGNVFSRRGLERVFPVPFAANRSITYAKSYVDPTGIIRNLYLDSAGQLWVENVNASPGTKTSLAITTPGTYARSITAFGREYIAISDGLHGQEVPLQYDGTNLDRVTQDGPGGPPTVTSFAYPSVAMVAGASSTVNLTTGTEGDPAGLAGGFYTSINFFTTSSVTGIAPGNSAALTGFTGTASPMNGTWIVTAVFTAGPNSLIQLAAPLLPSTTTFQAGGGAAAAVTLGGTTLVRVMNTVTVHTAAAHNLQVGYQAQITGVPAGVVGTSIASIVINNEDSPGVATITMVAAHGLVPGLFVSLNGIAATTVGGASAASRQGNVVTVTTTTPHGLTPGASITTSAFSAGSFNTNTTVAQVISKTIFTFLQVDADATATGGAIALNWPVPQSATPYYYEVLAAPTATKFQVQLSYSDGTWGAGGTVTYAWDGTFFVKSVPTTTSFTYQQYGPDDSSTTVGTVTPFGQVAPGQHQCQVAFLTRQGYVTAPSPPITFIANGGQYLSITDLPLGPPNVVGRILAFTGARGAYFFYIPVPPQVNGQVVGTATQINDNTSTAAVLDFSDNTLFAGLGINIPGNNLPAQIVLEGALGFGFYGSRLITYGQRNRIQNFLNLGFDGGFYDSQPDIPAGWLSDGSGGALDTGHFGQGWKIPVSSGNHGLIYQPAFQDAYGAPILTANTRYRLRVWLKPSAAAADLNFNCWIQSATTSFAAKAIIAGGDMSTAGSFLEVDFDTTMPATIPADMQLEIFSQATVSTIDLLVDEISIIYADNPYLDTIMYGSYVNNPEAFDGLSGKFGSAQDTRKVMDFGVIRQTMYFFTREPGGRIHQTSDNGTTEPSGWQITQVAANCGLVSAFALTRSQADDASSSGGEEWLAWISASGPRIFGGDQPFKLGQEIQPNWTGDFKRGFAGMNFPALLTAWALNNPTDRLILFGIPSLDQVVFTGITAPNIILVLNYRDLDTASQIASSSPTRNSMGGRLVATDHARKWTRWNLPMNGAAMMYRTPGGALETVLMGGTGNYPGT